MLPLFYLSLFTALFITSSSSVFIPTSRDQAIAHRTDQQTYWADSDPHLRADISSWAVVAAAAIILVCMQIILIIWLLESVIAAEVLHSIEEMESLWVGQLRDYNLWEDIIPTARYMMSTCYLQETFHQEVLQRMNSINICLIEITDSIAGE